MHLEPTRYRIVQNYNEHQYSLAELNMDGTYKWYIMCSHERLPELFPTGFKYVSSAMDWLEEYLSSYTW